MTSHRRFSKIKIYTLSIFERILKINVYELIQNDLHHRNKIILKDLMLAF